MKRLETLRQHLFPPAGALARSILFAGEPGAAPLSRDVDVWRAAAVSLGELRLSALALWAARQQGVDIPPEVRATLKGAVVMESAIILRLQVIAPTLLRLLGDEGIGVVVTKGVGIASTYPDPSLRPFRDIDLLVRPADFGRALEIFARAGFVEPPVIMRPRPFYTRYCIEATTLVNADGYSIDLHHRVPPWIWGERLDLRSLLGRSVKVPFGPEAVPVPSPAHNLLVAALHVISDRGREGYELLMWRDLLCLARAASEDEVLAESRRLGLDWCLSFVLGALPAEVRPTGLLARLGEPVISRGDALRITRLLPPARWSRHQLARAFRLPLGNALAYVAGYALPSRRFLRFRYGSANAYSAWWRDAFGRLRDSSRASGATPR